jgi:hypothetical protein
VHYHYYAQLQSADGCVDDVQPSWLSPESESRRNDSSSTAISTYNLYGQKKGSAPAPGFVLVERVPVGKAAIEGSGHNSNSSSTGGGHWALLPDPGTPHLY